MFNPITGRTIEYNSKTHIDLIKQGVLDKDGNLLKPVKRKAVRKDPVQRKTFIVE